jgi:hypothetical protein
VTVAEAIIRRPDRNRGRSHIAPDCVTGIGKKVLRALVAPGLRRKVARCRRGISIFC